MTRLPICLRAASALGLAALTLTTASAVHAQDLFVANSNTNTVLRFAGTGAGTFAKVSTTLSATSLSSPTGLAFDAHGDLFVADRSGGSSRNGAITEFAAGASPGTFGAATTLTDPSLVHPEGLGLDAHGNLFVVNNAGGSNFFGSVTEFAAGATPGTFGAVTTLTDPSLNSPFGLAVNALGSLFVANNDSGAITDFSAGAGPGTFGATKTLSGSAVQPLGLAFDAHGDLFSATSGGSSGTITEFAAGATPDTFGSPTSFADPSLAIPLGLVFDAQGDLFVANEFNGTITEFGVGASPGTFGPAQVIETGLNGPTFLAIGPPPPAVPEASTTISLSLLLALGLGGAVAAARRKKA